MNPVLVIDSLARAGAERCVTNLAVELVKRGLRVLVVSLTDHAPLAEEIRSAGVEVATLGHTGALRNLPSLVRTGARLRRRIQAHRASLVHSHLYIPDVLSRLFTPAGVPILTTLHSVDPWWHHSDRLRSRLKTSVDAWTGRLAHSRHVAVSEAVRDAATVALGIETERVRLIPNGIQLEKFNLREPRETSGPVIIQVGKLYEHKGQANALRAFKLVTGAIPEARLVFVGKGPLRQRLERLRADLDLDEAVTFAGETEDVAGALQSASVFWMPSVREGLPLACLEAMAMQLPVVASRVGGLNEVVVDGETGYLVPPGDAEVLAGKTIEILLNSECAHAMGRSGRSRVERLFRLEDTVQRYLQAYEDLRDGRW
jgi:glycosyltransferase involved in cell wall biosynthesis